MACSLSSLNSRVTHKARLLNPNMYDISINQDASLGTTDDIDGITFLLSEEETSQLKNVDQKVTAHRSPYNTSTGIKRITEEAVPEHLQNLFETACIAYI